METAIGRSLVVSVAVSAPMLVLLTLRALDGVATAMAIGALKVVDLALRIMTPLLTKSVRLLQMAWLRPAMASAFGLPTLEV